jgi:hypothetical protein
LQGDVAMSSLQLLDLMAHNFGDLILLPSEHYIVEGSVQGRTLVQYLIHHVQDGLFETSYTMTMLKFIEMQQRDRVCVLQKYVACNTGSFRNLNLFIIVHPTSLLPTFVSFFALHSPLPYVSFNCVLLFQNN